MNIFKKNNNNNNNKDFNSTDTIYEELWYDVNSAQKELSNAIYNCKVKHEKTLLFPKGTDLEESSKKEYKRAQGVVLSAVSGYKVAQEKLEEYYNSNFNFLVACKDWKPSQWPDSDTVIDNAIKAAWR